MPTREERIAALIRNGIMPATAEQIVNDVDANGGRLLTPGEAQALAVTTDTDIERARHWWWYSPDVPQRLRRILDARRVKGDAGAASQP